MGGNALPPEPSPPASDRPAPSVGGGVDGAAVGAAVGLAIALAGHVGPTAWDLLLGVVLAGLALALVDGIVSLLRWLTVRVLRRPRPGAAARIADARSSRLSFPLAGAVLVLLPWVAGDTVIGAVHAGAAGSLIIVATTLLGVAVGGARRMLRSPSRGRPADAPPAPFPRRLVVAAVVVGAGVLWLALVAWLAVPGPGADVVAAPPPADVPALTLPDPGRPGPETVREASYGSNVDPHRAAFGADATWRTEPVDGSDAGIGFGPLLGPHVWLATRARVDRLPINGTVWYPEGAQDAPLVLIVHGNHGLTRASDRGYAYLGEHLASHGYVAASVDQNFLNGSFVGDLEGGEHPLRARVLLEHLRGWERWTAEGEPMAGMVDLDRVVLVGHSRGGEAAAHVAAMVADPAQAPDRAWTLPSDSPVRVRAVVAIAPSDRQWVPDGGPRRLADTSYLLLAGGLDGDVTTLQGLAQYHRVDLTAGSDAFRAFAYLQRANHGQFNTVWGRGDAGWLNSTILDRGALLSGEAQRDATRTLITAFLATAVQGDDGYRAVFTRPDAARGWLPDDVIVTGYADATQRILPVDASATAGFAAVDRLELRARDGTRSLGVRALHLRWAAGDDPTVDVAMPDGVQVEAGDVLAIAFGSADLRPPAGIVVEVADADGLRAALPLDATTSLRPPLPGRVGKWPAWSSRYRVTIDPAWPAEHLLQTYELPLARFVVAEPELDLDQLVVLTLRPDGDEGGSVHLGGVAVRPRSEAELAATGDGSAADGPGSGGAGER
jgi:dienelactone hydrolase